MRNKVKPIDISKPIKITEENLGSIFTSLRLTKDYTQEALALTLDVAPLTVRKWEHKISTPSIPYFLNLLDFYGYKIMLVKEEDK